MAQFDLKKATIKIKDGAAAYITLKIAEGKLDYDEKRMMRYIRDRGVLSTVVEGDEEPMDVKFDVIWTFLTQGSGGEPVTPEDALKQRGGASGWTSSDSDICAPYAVDIEIFYDSDCGSVQDETTTLPDFRWEAVNHDLKTGMLSVSGKCNAKQATVARS